MIDDDEWASARPLEDQVADLRATVATLTELVTQTGQASAGKDKEGKPPKFEDLPSFVGWLAGVYRREVFDSTDRAWCPEWWKHDEAAVRLDAMWHAFEALRQDPATGLSAWLRDHADVHMGQLLLPHGTFRGCSARKGHAAVQLAPLPLVDPPEEWWAPEDSGL